MSYLPYEEPGIATILSLTSLIVLLNAARYGLDKVLYCGLVGEIFLGTVWGLPLGGTALLSLHTQEVIQTLGYLGLIGLVFHGGLSTSPTHLRQAMLPSISVATFGLLLPIALSFLLLFFPFDFDGKQLFPTPLAAFSAGASLCSTSLGTTFAVLSSANMLKTRVGVVLVGAAMMDDIVGLVMVNIITTLGQGITGPWQVARPIVASFGLILVTIFITSLVIRPLCAWLRGSLPSHDIDQLPASQRMCFRGSNILGYLRKRSAVGFIFSLGTLLVFITVASFIDASVLLAAFLAGMVVHFVWGSVVEDMSFQSAIAMFDRYYQPLLDYLLVPFFFASIGFSIPLTSMFRGSIVWKGLVYAILMAVAKFAVCTVVYGEHLVQEWESRRQASRHRQAQAGTPSGPPHAEAMLLAFAMVARGEIGFLIASLSQSSGTLTLQNDGIIAVGASSEDLFLVIVWAVVLCTIAGPVVVGILVKRQNRGVVHNHDVAPS